MAPLHVVTLTVQRELPKYEIIFSVGSLPYLCTKNVTMAPLHVATLTVQRELLKYSCCGFILKSHHKNFTFFRFSEVTSLLPKLAMLRISWTSLLEGTIGSLTSLKPATYRITSISLPRWGGGFYDSTKKMLILLCRLVVVCVLSVCSRRVYLA